MEALAFGIEELQIVLVLENLRHLLRFAPLQAIGGVGDPAEQIIGKALQSLLEYPLGIAPIVELLIGDIQIIVELWYVGVPFDEWLQDVQSFFGLLE